MYESTYKNFIKRYNKKESQILSNKLIADLETPISSLIKLMPKQKYSFLLESVEGGDQRGRFSFIGINPDVIWKCKKNKVIISGTNKDFIKKFS